MKLFGYDISVVPNRWESDSYSGVVVANTMEEAIGMIIHAHDNSTRSNFMLNDEIDPENIYEINREEPGVICLGHDHYEE